MTPLFRGLVKGFIVKLNNSYRFKNYLKKFEGEEVVLSVKKLRKYRSTEQNNYYWGVIIEMIGEHLGYRPDEYEERVHEVLKSMFLGKYIDLNTKDGIEKIKVIKSTASLKTSEFEEYLSNIRQWASEYLMLTVPLPNEVDLEVV